MRNKNRQKRNKTQLQPQITYTYSSYEYTTEIAFQTKDKLHNKKHLDNKLIISKTI